MLSGHDESFQTFKKAFLNDPKCQEEVFWTWVCWIDLILHIMIELNVVQHLATLPDHDRSFEALKNAFLNDPKRQKKFFGHSLQFCLVDPLDIVWNGWMISLL